MASPGFAELAEEARKRFMQFTGLQCVVVHTKEEGNYAAKLELPSMFNQTVVWFDADLWFIRPTDLSIYDNRSEFFAVRDPGIHDPAHFPFHDSRLLGLDVLQYFNSGFYIWNNRHRAAFEEARSCLKENKAKLKDFGEQSSLNAGVQRKSKVRLLSNKLNYMPFAEMAGLQAMEPKRAPNTVHAAGYGGDWKIGSLRYFEAHYTGKYDNASPHYHPG